MKIDLAREKEDLFKAAYRVLGYVALFNAGPEIISDEDLLNRASAATYDVNAHIRRILDAKDD